MHIQAVAIIAVILTYVNISTAQRRTLIDDRPLRPPSQERPCTSTSAGNCPKPYNDKVPEDEKTYRPLSRDINTQPNSEIRRPSDDNNPTESAIRDDRPKIEELPKENKRRPISDDYLRKPVKTDEIASDRKEVIPNEKAYIASDNMKKRPDRQEDLSEDAYPDTIGGDDVTKRAGNVDPYDPTRRAIYENPDLASQDEYTERSRRDEVIRPSIRRDENIRPSRRDEDIRPSGTDEDIRPPRRDEDVRPTRRDEDIRPTRRDEDIRTSRKDEDIRTVRIDDNIRPIRRDDNIRPIRRDDNIRPIRRDEEVRPARRDEEVRPARRDEEVRPARRDEEVRPARRDEVRPARRDEEVRPARRDEEVRPARRDEEVGPARRDEFLIPKYDDRDDNTKPTSSEARPRPISREEYPNYRRDTNPESRDELQRRPITRDDIPKSRGRDDIPRDYESRPQRRDEIIPKPVIRDESSRTHNSRPTVYEEIDSRPDYNMRTTVRENKEIRESGYNYPKQPGYDDHKDSRGTSLDSDYDSKSESSKQDNVQREKFITSNKNGNCICVPYYQCKDRHIVTDGSGIIDARRRYQPEEKLAEEKEQPPSCGPIHVCCNIPETSTVKPYEHRCGVRNPSGINSRILSPSNKGEADFGEWPWQAAVLKAEGTVNIFQCGGVLIDKYHVLTVAHCVFHLYKYNDYPLKVRLGEWDTQKVTEFLAHEDYKVSKIIIHEEFRNSSLWNDIAILRLQEPVSFAPHIDTICLPRHDEIFSGQNCVVTGWGKDSYQGGTFSSIMKELALQVIDNFNCEEMLRKTRLGSFFQLHEGFLCAGGEDGVDSCKGDGGGPLVCYRKDRSYALAGLVSWGIDCGQKEVPGVYVKVQRYLEWISKNTGIELQDYWPKS